MAATSPSPGGVNTNNNRFSGAGVSVFILGRVLCIFEHRIASQRSSAFGRSLILMMATIEHRRQPSRGQTGSFRRIDRSSSAVLLRHKHSYTFTCYLLPVIGVSKQQQQGCASMERETKNEYQKNMMHLLDLFENDAILVLSIKYMRIQLNNKSGVWQQKND